MIALELGRVIASGAPAEVLENPAVIESYLGAPGEEPPADDPTVELPVARPRRRTRARAAAARNGAEPMSRQPTEAATNGAAPVPVAQNGDSPGRVDQTGSGRISVAGRTAPSVRRTRAAAGTRSKREVPPDA